MFGIESELNDMKTFLNMAIKEALAAGPDLSESGNYFQVGGIHIYNI